MSLELCVCGGSLGDLLVISPVMYTYILYVRMYVCMGVYITMMGSVSAGVYHEALYEQ